MFGWILQRNFPGKIVSYETMKLIKTAKELGISIRLIDPREFEIVVNQKDRKSILLNNVITKIPDFIFPRMGSTISYFILAVMRHFEKLGVYCVNSSASIEIVKDKLFQMQILANSNFSIPKTILVKFPVNIDWISAQLGFPVIVKALSGSRGSGVFMCENANILDDLMKIIQVANKDSNFVFQEFISDSNGRDLRVFIVGNKILGAIERKSLDKSFKANFSRGGSTHSYTISEKLKIQIIEIVKLFNLEIAGIDLLFDVDEFRICEINSCPGFKGFEEANPIDVSVEILTYIKNQVQLKKLKN